MATVTENRIATEAAVRMIGPAGGAFIAAAILVSTFGCVNGLTLAGARVAPTSTGGGTGKSYCLLT
jgi:APA family basic amino acid/polyamine antiporter